MSFLNLLPLLTKNLFCLKQIFTYQVGNENNYPVCSKCLMKWVELVELLCLILHSLPLDQWMCESVLIQGLLTMFLMLCLFLSSSKNVGTFFTQPCLRNYSLLI